MKKILFLSMLFGLFFACKKEKSVKPAEVINTSNCDTTITYNSQIKTIIDNNCVGCHSGPAPSGGAMLTTYNQVMVHVNDGHINQKVLVDKSMPKGGSLSTADLTAIACWLGNGAKE